jgi:hypothetical protein
MALLLRTFGRDVPQRKQALCTAGGGCHPALFDAVSGCHLALLAAAALP